MSTSWRGVCPTCRRQSVGDVGSEQRCRTCVAKNRPPRTRRAFAWLRIAVRRLLHNRHGATAYFMGQRVEWGLRLGYFTCEPCNRCTDDDAAWCPFCGGKAWVFGLGPNHPDRRAREQVVQPPPQH